MSANSAFSVFGIGGGGGGSTLISSQSASSSPSITFSGLSGTYVSYKLICTNLLVGTGNANLNMTINGSSSSVYDYAWWYSNGVAGSGIGASGEAQSSMNIITALNASLSSAFSVDVYSPSAADHVSLNWQVSNVNFSGNLVSAQGAGNYGANGPVTSITFTPSAGNIASGNFYLYGMTAATGGNVGGGLLNVQYFTTSGSQTYTPTAGTNNLLIKAWGAGGGAGSTNNVTLGASGAGGGAYVEAYFANNVSQTIVIGAGGVGATANNATNATNGGNTTFGSTVLVAAGGEASANGNGQGAGDGGLALACTVPGNGFAESGSSGGFSNSTIANVGSGSAFGGSAGLAWPTLAGNTGGVAQGGFGGNSAVNGGNGGVGLMIVYEYS